MTEFNADNFKLNEDEFYEVSKRKSSSNKVVFAIFFKYFKITKTFPKKDDPNLDKIISSVKKQLNINIKVEIDWKSSTLKTFRRTIRKKLGIKVISQKEQDQFIVFMKKFIFPKGVAWNRVEEEAYLYFSQNNLAFLTKNQQNRFLKSAYNQFEYDFFNAIDSSLSTVAKQTLDSLLNDIQSSEKPLLSLIDLKKHNAYLKKSSILELIEKYKFLHSIRLPEMLEDIVSHQFIKKYHDRILVESPSHIKTHSRSQRYAMLASFCFIKLQEILDILTDFLLKLIHKLQTKAEKYVDNYILSEVKRVNGKFDALFLLASTSIKNPTGIIEDNIYTAVPKNQLCDIINDLEHKGKWFKNKVKAKSLSLYTHGNKKIIWDILDVLPLETDQACYGDVLKALAVSKKSEKVVIDSKKHQLLFGNTWLSFIEKKDENGSIQINNNAYALAVLERLSQELNVKNIWVNGSLRYRNPLKDLPNDFKENMKGYFDLLSLPENANCFIKNLKKDLDQNLLNLNNTILKNDKVILIKRKNKGHIKITPSAPQAPPHNIHLVHHKITKKWGSISLMDILKEVDYRINFTQHLKSVGTSERIKKDDLKRRKLLCLYGIGTNTGLKRIASGQVQDTLSDLHYVKLRYIDKYSIRTAIQDIVNATIKIRNPTIWGKSSTGCSCDSKKISVWDQNLLSEWHVRYGGKGVMVYWHVDKKSLVIFSQIKTCSSSEVGSMMRGVLDHDTIMEMDEIYTDTHGQSTIGFAFSHLLGFDLLPRLKNIAKQKLYQSSKNTHYENLTDIVASQPINWSKIKNHYNDIVQHVAALKTGCADASILLKRLSAKNKNNPIYQALLELGKAVRTIFLCRYLRDEPLRIEINESLNIVERVNSIMGFIFYGKLGEISTNNIDNQELGILGLHLLQACMVYINTLMIQEVLGESELKLTSEDLRALSPLIHAHITPYGSFLMDMNARIPFKPIANENNDDRNTHPRSRKSKTIRKAAA